MRRVGLTTIALLAGCALTGGEVTDTENGLSAAGFQVRPGNTPQRQAMLATLPPNKLVQRVRGDSVIYLYADPKGCQCLYAGDQPAFARFQQARQAQRVASERLEAARFESDEFDEMPFGFDGGIGFGRRF